MTKRAFELGVKYVFQDISNKIIQLELLIKALDLDYSNIAYIGDDINDLECMRLIGFAACPKDAITEVQEISHFISKYDGGKGAVREIIDYIIK